jgi:hypothetical protein
MAKYLGRLLIDGLQIKWTQMECDGCGTLGDETVPGHYLGVMALPPGWAGRIEGGVARCYCDECQAGAQLMSKAG